MRLIEFLRKEQTEDNSTIPCFILVDSVILFEKYQVFKVEVVVGGWIEIEENL